MLRQADIAFIESPHPRVASEVEAPLVRTGFPAGHQRRSLDCWRATGWWPANTCDTLGATAYKDAPILAYIRKLQELSSAAAAAADALTPTLTDRVAAVVGDSTTNTIPSLQQALGVDARAIGAAGRAWIQTEADDREKGTRLPAGDAPQKSSKRDES